MRKVWTTTFGLMPFDGAALKHTHKLHSPLLFTWPYGMLIFFAFARRRQYNKVMEYIRRLDVVQCSLFIVWYSTVCGVNIQCWLHTVAQLTWPQKAFLSFSLVCVRVYLKSLGCGTDRGSHPWRSLSFVYVSTCRSLLRYILYFLSAYYSSSI